MKIFIVEKECDDTYYGPNFVAAFMTEALAKESVDKIKEDYIRREYMITEVEVSEEAIDLRN